MAEELAKAKAGEKLTEKQTSNALDQALDRLGTMQKTTAKAREMMHRGGTSLVNGLEHHGTAFAFAALDGYGGDKWRKVGGVPWKLVGGLVLEGIGVYQTMSGDDGSHLQNVGRGLSAVDLVRLGQEAGQKMAAPAAPAAAAAAAAAKPGEAPAAPAAKGEGEGMRRVNWTPRAQQTPRRDDGPGPGARPPMRPARWAPVRRAA